jgi:hypothetical protein
MAKFFTKRKHKTKFISEKISAEVKEKINGAVDYVQKWHQDELFNLILHPDPNKLPICVPMGKNSYLIGKYLVKEYKNSWIVFNWNTRKKLLFSQRLVAVIYALCIQTKHIQLSEDIQKIDRDFLRILQRLEQLSYSLNCARRKKNWWKVDHLTNQVVETDYKLKHIKKQLEKTIVLAKYFKIWE